MAPRLIASIDTALPPGERGVGSRAGEIEGDLAKAPILLEYELVFLSLFKG
jgi:hypothetical protein